MSARIHVGLHKTASTFMQRDVFPDVRGIAFNPPELFQAATKVFCAEPDRAAVARSRFLRAARKSPAHVTLSHEGLGGNPYSNYANLEFMAQMLGEAFPNGECLLVLRSQPDWLLSLYKQTLHEGEFLTIDEFLNFHNGVFVGPTAREERNVDALAFDHSRIVEELERAFGREHVHVVFYEELERDPARFLRRVCEAFDFECIRDVQLNRRNRGFSALAVNLTLWSRRVPLPRFVRDRWRGWLQNRMDRYVYVDWDLLGSKRRLLNEHYRAINRSLDPYFPDQEIRALYTHC